MSASDNAVPSSRFTRSVRTVMCARSIGFGYTSIAPSTGSAPATCDEQFHRTRGAGSGVVRIDTALEARARLGAQPEPLGGPGDATRLEVRRLEQDLGRGAGDLGRGAAHDSRRCPARPRSASQINRSALVSVRSTPSRVVIFSPSVASRTTMPRPGNLARSNACNGRQRSSIT